MRRLLGGRKDTVVKRLQRKAGNFIANLELFCHYFLI